MKNPEIRILKHYKGEKEDEFEKTIRVNLNKTLESLQINNNTGISMDYTNNGIGNRVTYILKSPIEFFRFGLRRYLSKNSDEPFLKHIKPYKEYFWGYSDMSVLINDKTKKSIELLDQYSAELNTLSDKIVNDLNNQDNINPDDKEKFREIVNKINFLVYGDDTQNI